MLQSLYARTLALAGSRRAVWWMAAISFAESSFFPLPPDILMIPMILARVETAWRLAFICTVSSVAGGVLGYAIGYAVFDQLAQPVIAFYGYSEKFAAFQAMYAQYGVWVILIKGLTPIPFKIVTIASGAAKFDFWVFLGASILTRGGRFFLLAALLRLFGNQVWDFIERRLMLVTSMLAAGIIGGFVLLRLF